MAVCSTIGSLLDQEIPNIGRENVGVLSPVICPCCATGGDADDTLTQRQLYDRMDLVCAAGVRDFSVFTFFEVVHGPQGKQDPQFGRTLPKRYFKAFQYFRTCKKKLEPGAGNTLKLKPATRAAAAFTPVLSHTWDHQCQYDGGTQIQC